MRPTVLPMDRGADAAVVQTAPASSGPLVQPDTQVTLTPGLSIVTVDGDLNVYDANAGTTVMLNASAAAILQELDSGATVAEATGTLASAHDVDPSVMARDVRSAVEQLIDAGLVRLATARPD